MLALPLKSHTIIHTTISSLTWTPRPYLSLAAEFNYFVTKLSTLVASSLEYLGKQVSFPHSHYQNHIPLILFFSWLFHTPHRSYPWVQSLSENLELHLICLLSSQSNHLSTWWIMYYLHHQVFIINVKFHLIESDPHQLEFRYP